MSAWRRTYNEIVEFIKNYDNTIKISKYSISKLKNRPVINRQVPQNNDTLSFVSYIKSQFTELDVIWLIYL